MTDLMDRLITLSLGTSEDQQYAESFDRLAVTARQLAPSHSYVNLSAQVVGADDEDDEETCVREHLYHDANTTIRVRQVMAEHGLNAREANKLMKALASAGILFRQHLPEEEKTS